MTTSPTITELPYHRDAKAYFKKLNSLPNPMWLESSQVNDEQYFDILTASPLEICRDMRLSELEEQVQNLLPQADLEHLRDCPFPGGVIGYYEYEGLHSNFGLDGESEARSCWAIFDWALIQDHNQQRCYAVFLPTWKASNITARVALLLGENPKTDQREGFKVSTFQYDMPKQHYKASFEKIQSYIHNGDCYQVNFTQRFSTDFQGDTASAFIHLRQALSGPYSCYLDFDDHQILSFSPEQFIQLQEGVAQTKPIKGTIKRGATAGDDGALAKELLESEKNKAENLMIVDLLRNDFSKNCLPDSVKVPALFALESYKNVHHLVSTVTGSIKPGVSLSQFFEDCFPGGSITGAPKKRAMEIIDELETHPRRIYCGSVVCFGANKNLNSNIAIRTLLIEKGKAYCWGGGGIVAESTVDEEYAESIQKVCVLLDALENANQTIKR